MSFSIKLQFTTIFYGYFILLNFDIGHADSSISSNGNNEDYGNYPTNTGDIAYVKLLTASPRLKRDLSSYSYHILEINVPAKNKTITVHLAKETISVSSEFRTLVYDFENGVGEPYTEILNKENNHDCFYSGVIPGNVHGIASLSSCNKDSPGFIGVITDKEKHFILEPLNPQNTEHGTMSTDSTYIAHTIKEVTSTDQPLQASPELKKGIPDSLLDQLSTRLKREISEENIINNPLSEGSSDVMARLTPLAASKTRKGQISSNTKSKSGSKGGQKDIDLAIYTDAALYRHFQKRYPQNTLKNMEAWILTFVDGVNRIYQHPSLGMKMTIRLVHLEIMKSDPPSLHPHLDGETYLGNFRKFAGKKNPKVEFWDHASLLTGVDIRLADGSPLLLGIAYDGTMCVPELFTSLVQADTWESVFVAAHELGHNMGMEHDAVGVSASCTTDTFLMAAHTGPGKVLWSPCSSKNLKDFISTGYDQRNKKHLRNGPACLGVQTKKSKSIKYTDKKLPGEKYNAKDQCVYAFGPSAAPDGATSNICNVLMCKYTQGFSGSFVKQAHPALEGTSCGSNKYCRGAVCTTMGKK